MSSTEYHYVPNISGSLRLVCLADSGISSVYGGNATVLPFERVTEVRLWFSPTRFDAQRFCCEIVGTPGISISFQSTTCEGLGQFVPQSTAYRALVKELHQRLAHQNPGVNYVTGVSGLRYAVNIGCMGIGLGGMVLAILTFGIVTLGPGAIIPLALIAFYLPRTWRWLRTNKRKNYDPLSIPDALLPPSEADSEIATNHEPPVLPTSKESSPSLPIDRELERTLANPAWSGEPPPGGGRWYNLEDFGPIAEPGDHSWMSVAGSTTHWADATQYAEEANDKLKAGLIGPPLDPPPQGEQPLPPHQPRGC